MSFTLKSHAVHFAVNTLLQFASILFCFNSIFTVNFFVHFALMSRFELILHFALGIITFCSITGVILKTTKKQV